MTCPPTNRHIIITIIIIIFYRWKFMKFRSKIINLTFRLVAVRVYWSSVKKIFVFCILNPLQVYNIIKTPVKTCFIFNYDQRCKLVYLYAVRCFYRVIIKFVKTLIVNFLYWNNNILFFTRLTKNFLQYLNLWIRGRWLKIRLFSTRT